jgi:hypothetical protein
MSPDKQDLRKIPAPLQKVLKSNSKSTHNLQMGSTQLWSS